MAINMCRCQCHGWFSRCFMYRFLVSGYSSGSMTSHQPSNNGPSHNLQIQYLQSVSHYWFSKLFFFFSPKVSNIVDPLRGEILQGNSGRHWCCSSDWRSYHSYWFGVQEVLHLPNFRSLTSLSLGWPRFSAKISYLAQRLSTRRMFSSAYSEASTSLCRSHSLSQ